MLICKISENVFNFQKEFCRKMKIIDVTSSKFYLRLSYICIIFCIFQLL